MKEKIKKALINKYKKLGYSPKAIDAVVAHLEKNVTEEDQIEEAVSGIEDLLNAFQGEIDSRVTTAVDRTKKEATDPSKSQPQPNPDPNPKSGDDPAPAPAGQPDLAQALTAALAPLVKEIADLKAGNVSKSRQQLLEDKLKDANPAFKASTLKGFKRMNFASDEDFDEYLSEVETDLGEQVQIETNDKLKSAGSPLLGNSALKDGEVSPHMKQILKQRADAVKAATGTT